MKRWALFGVYFSNSSSVHVLLSIGRIWPLCSLLNLLKSEIEQEADDDKDLSEHDEEEEIAPMKEDEEEKGMMKSDKEEKRIPKWKLAKGLKEKKSDEVKCDEWGIPKVLDRVHFPQRFREF
ncbi:hypothetical protein ACS0TY_009073 [Phlomoides rotata]